MPQILNHSISACLIGLGALAWVAAGPPLVKDSRLKYPLNILGINESPYGEVFAMAMQGSINTYFDGAISPAGHPHDDKSQPCKICGIQSSGTELKNIVKLNLPWPDRFGKFLVSLEKMSAIRTNPKAPSKAHRIYLRRQVEDKLRFAYRLDPSHYVNYNSLHFFLTEPQLGTRPVLTSAAIKLAEETIAYCLRQDHDPRPALTAAGACTNVLQMMFDDQLSSQPRFTTLQMRQYLQLLDQYINRYVLMAQEWDRSKNWELLSPQRIAECDERFAFIRKMRDAAEQTIIRYEKLPAGTPKS